MSKNMMELKNLGNKQQTSCSYSKPSYMLSKRRFKGLRLTELQIVEENNHAFYCGNRNNIFL